MTTVACTRKHKRELSKVVREEGKHTALVVSAIALAPLLAFAALWTCLIVMVGGAAILHSIFGF